MTALERETPQPEGEASELEGGGTEQSWGQGEGTHEPTIPDDDEEGAADEAPSTYSGGTAAQLDDPDLPLAREDEGMDR
jgi:hypothetical protein